MQIEDIVFSNSFLVLFQIDGRRLGGRFQWVQDKRLEDMLWPQLDRGILSRLEFLIVETMLTIAA